MSVKSFEFNQSFEDLLFEDLCLGEYGSLQFKSLC
jgi:hypothetical protein